MFDSITYRIPNKEIITLNGTFREILNPSEFDGFIVSDFSGETIYGLEQESSSSEFKKSPIFPFVISKENYLEKINQLISQLSHEKCEKVIFSRIKKVEAENTTPTELFKRLEEKYPTAFCYCLQSATLGTWIGATPEKLIAFNNEFGSTSSLAGTKKAEDSSSWKSKEINEQEIVTQYISQLLNKYTSNSEQSATEELIAGPVKHLHTSFHFQLPSNQIFPFLKEFHPTPAVCGLPKQDALQLIAENEMHSRELYAGMIGVHRKGNTELFVNLRCAQYFDEYYYLYVGGGLTKDSIPESEWEETENKALTILNLLQIK